MKIKILCVGKIKEDFYRKAILEFEKRLSRYCKLEVIEVADEKTPDLAGEAIERQIKEKEGARLLKRIREDTYVVALAIHGKELDSLALSRSIERLGLQGKSSVAFVIGGSLGLSESVLKRADEQLSFSKLTFPHQLMRVILLEQIYRSFRIIHREPYHK